MDAAFVLQAAASTTSPASERPRLGTREELEKDLKECKARVEELEREYKARVKELEKEKEEALAIHSTILEKGAAFIRGEDVLLDGGASHHVYYSPTIPEGSFERQVELAHGRQGSSLSPTYSRCEREDRLSQ